MFENISLSSSWWLNEFLITLWSLQCRLITSLETSLLLWWLNKHPNLWFNKETKTFLLDKSQVMSHKAGGVYRLQTGEHPADAQTRSWEDSRNVTLGDPRSLSHPIHISMSHVRKITISDAHHRATSLWFSIGPPRSPALLAVEAAGLRRRVCEECRVLLRVPTALHSSDFYCLEFVFSQRSFWSAAYPPVLFLKHTQARMHTQRNAFWM